MSFRNNAGIMRRKWAEYIYIYIWVHVVENHGDVNCFVFFIGKFS